MTHKEVAAFLTCSIRKVGMMKAAGELPPTVGVLGFKRSVRWLRADMERWRECGGDMTAFNK